MFLKYGEEKGPLGNERSRPKSHAFQGMGEYKKEKEIPKCGEEKFLYTFQREKNLPKAVRHSMHKTDAHKDIESTENHFMVRNTICYKVSQIILDFCCCSVAVLRKARTDTERLINIIGK